MIKELTKELVDHVLREFPQLQTLSLCDNGKFPVKYCSDISKIENMSGFIYLHTLDISRNKLLSLVGLEMVTTLRELRVANNQIVSLEGL